MDKIKKMWRNLSLRKSIILYISAFVILAILLSAGTATLCNNATKTIESKYPPTGEKYYLTNENGERLGDGNYIGVAPVAMSEKDQRLLSICEVAPIIATPIYSALCIITATLLFYRNKLKKPLTELKAASEMISNNNLDFSIKYDSKDELGELCSSFETMRFTLANNFSEMWRQMEERKQLNAAFAHDLRTPLTVLKGYNEILQSNHDPITKSTAATMRKHIFRLERYVDSMSHLRRLEDAQPLDGLYDTIVELEERIEDAKLRRSSIEMEAITLDNIYKLMLNFGKLYDIISDEEKKNLITYLIKEIQIYPNGESEMPLKSIEFNFPIYRDGQEVRRLLWEKGNTVETVCLLVK